MKSAKFTISYEVASGRGFGRFPEYFAKVFLNCPNCHHRYELRHVFCGMSLYVEDAIERHMCNFCMSNGQEHEAKLPLEIADCPKCGHKCRTMEDIEETKVRKSRHIHENELPLAIKKRLPRTCEACGFTFGLEIHHKDWNHSNNNPENLQVLCKWCHVQVNKLGKPEFERMLEMIRSCPSRKAALRKSAEEFYNQLPKQRRPAGENTQLPLIQQ